MILSNCSVNNLLLTFSENNETLSKMKQNQNFNIKIFA